MESYEREFLPKRRFVRGEGLKIWEGSVAK